MSESNGWEVLAMDGVFVDDDAVDECIDAMDLEFWGIKP
jgi:hypothetical protein